VHELFQKNFFSNNKSISEKLLKLTYAQFGHSTRKLKAKAQEVLGDMYLFLKSFVQQCTKKFPLINLLK
jgi:hypothetical protein